MDDATGTIGAEELSDGEIAEARAARMPPRLKVSEGLKSFDFLGDPKTVIEKVMAEYGLMVVFEGGYQAPPAFRFRLADVPFEWPCGRWRRCPIRSWFR